MKTNNKTLKYIPQFKSEDEEREFWATHDFTDYMHQFKRIHMDLSNLKLTTTPITVRLPASLIFNLKQLANKRDVPYQSLLKILLARALDEELGLRPKRK